MDGIVRKPAPLWLVGAIIGLLIAITAILAVKYSRRIRKLEERAIATEQATARFVDEATFAQVLDERDRLMLEARAQRETMEQKRKPQQTAKATLQQRQRPVVPLKAKPIAVAPTPDQNDQPQQEPEPVEESVYEPSDDMPSFLGDE